MPVGKWRSNAYNDAIAAAGREFINTVEVVEGNVVETYTNADIELERTCSDGYGMTIGQTYSAEARIKIYEPLRTVNYSFAKYRVSTALKVDEDTWETINMGVYYAYEVSTEDDYATLDIVAYDVMMKLDVPYEPTLTTAPYSRRQIFEDIATQFGLTPDDSFQAADYTTPEYTNYFEENQFQSATLLKHTLTPLQGYTGFTDIWTDDDYIFEYSDYLEVSNFDAPIQLDNTHKYALYVYGFPVAIAMYPSVYAFSGQTPLQFGDVVRVWDDAGNIITPTEALGETTTEYLIHIMNEEGGWICTVYENIDEIGKVDLRSLGINNATSGDRYIYWTLIDITETFGDIPSNTALTKLFNSRIFDNWGINFFTEGYHELLHVGHWYDNIVLPATVRETLGWLFGTGGYNAFTDVPSDTWDETLTGRYFLLALPNYTFFPEYVLEDGVEVEGEFTITSLKTGTEDNTISFGEGKGISFYNPYITYEDAERIFNRYVGDKYTVGTVKWFGYPPMSFGSFVGDVKLKGDTSSTPHRLFPIMHEVLNLSGGCQSEAQTYGNYETEIDIDDDNQKVQRIQTQKTQLEQIWDKLKELEARVAALEG